VHFAAHSAEVRVNVVRMLTRLPCAHFAHDDGALQFCLLVPRDQLWQRLQGVPGEVAHKVLEMQHPVCEAHSHVGRGFGDDFVHIEPFDFEEAQAAPDVDEGGRVVAVQVPAHHHLHHMVEDLGQGAARLVGFARSRFEAESAHPEALAPHVAHQLLQRDDAARIGVDESKHGSQLNACRTHSHTSVS